MPWFRFDKDFDFKPRPGVTIAYRAGRTLLVTTACAARAEALGRGVMVRKPGPEAETSDGERQ
ncbi:hypothetical protein [Pelagibacterium limicola]|uniref:hypothetical protein n=1 Tax=Pelagibacterium limicola TaxID=2791022 RepID=UPI0018AFA05E|nr:hypothetical protein [Pelagibacterium limicola]